MKGHAVSRFGQRCGRLWDLSGPRAHPSSCLRLLFSATRRAGRSPSRALLAQEPAATTPGGAAGGEGSEGGEESAGVPERRPRESDFWPPSRAASAPAASDVVGDGQAHAGDHVRAQAAIVERGRAQAGSPTWQGDPDARRRSRPRRPTPPRRDVHGAGEGPPATPPLLAPAAALQMPAMG